MVHYKVRVKWEDCIPRLLSSQQLIVRCEWCYYTMICLRIQRPSHTTEAPHWQYTRSFLAVLVHCIIVSDTQSIHPKIPLIHGPGKFNCINDNSGHSVLGEIWCPFMLQARHIFCGKAPWGKGWKASPHDQGAQQIFKLH